MMIISILIDYKGQLAHVVLGFDLLFLTLKKQSYTFTIYPEYKNQVKSNLL